MRLSQIIIMPTFIKFTLIKTSVHITILMQLLELGNRLSLTSPSKSEAA